MSTMLSGRAAGRRSLHTVNDRGGAELQVEAAGAGALSGVREGLGKGVTVCTLPNPSRRGEMGVGAGGRQGSRG